MRTSKQAHTLAKLRLTIDPQMRQKEFAAILGYSPDMVQSVEMGRAPLSYKLAVIAVLKTGVNLGWLLQDDVKAPIVDQYFKPYTRDTFKEHQRKAFDPHDIPRVTSGIAHCVQKLAAILCHAYAVDRFPEMEIKLNLALNEVGNEATGGKPFNNGILGSAFRSKHKGLRPDFKPIADAIETALNKGLDAKDKKTLS